MGSYAFRAEKGNKKGSSYEQNKTSPEDIEYFVDLNGHVTEVKRIEDSVLQKKTLLRHNHTI